MVAVAAVDDIRGWSSPRTMPGSWGARWGLGANDMLLLLVKGGDWYVACGDNLADQMTDTQQTKLKNRPDTPTMPGIIPRQRWISSARATWCWPRPWARAAPTSSLLRTGSGSSPLPASGVSVSGVVLLIVGIFVIWSLLDRMRYNRYRRRPVVAGGPVYYPIFWGRRPRAPRPPRPPRGPGGPMGGSPRPPRPPGPPVQQSPARANYSRSSSGGPSAAGPGPVASAIAAASAAADAPPAAAGAEASAARAASAADAAEIHPRQSNKNRTSGVPDIRDPLRCLKEER